MCRLVLLARLRDRTIGCYYGRSWILCRVRFLTAMQRWRVCEVAWSTFNDDQQLHRSAEELAACEHRGAPAEWRNSALPSKSCSKQLSRLCIKHSTHSKLSTLPTTWGWMIQASCGSAQEQGSIVLGAEQKDHSALVSLICKHDAKSHRLVGFSALS